MTTATLAEDIKLVFGRINQETDRLLAQRLYLVDALSQIARLDSEAPCGPEHDLRIRGALGEIASKALLRLQGDLACTN